MDGEEKTGYLVYILQKYMCGQSLCQLKKVQRWSFATELRNILVKITVIFSWTKI